MHKTVSRLVKHMHMITVFVEEYNIFSQDFYDSVLFNLPLHQLQCPCCHHAGCCIGHGSYKRAIHSAQGDFHLDIYRVKCTECGRTHAILLSSIIPYSQIPLVDQYHVVEALEEGSDRNSVCDEDGIIDENNVKHIVRRYTTHWKQRLLSESISISKFPDIIISCFAVYSIQFLQIRRNPNILFSRPT